MDSPETESVKSQVSDLISSNDAGLFRALFDLMPAPGWTARADGYFDFYNKAWYDYTGTTFEEMQGWGWQKVHDPTLLAEVSRRWNEALETGAPLRNFEFPLRRADGVYRWFVTQINPVRDQSGEIIRWVGFNYDIQDQKDFTALLERRVKERTEEVEKVRDEAIRANEFKSQFVATVSHEIRTPLSGVIGMAELLTRDPSLPPSCALLAHQLFESSKSLLSILNDVLDFSKLEAGKAASEEIEFDVRSIVMDVLTLSRGKADEKGLAIDVEIDPELPKVLVGDAAKIRQVLLNFTHNALKFTETGAIEIGVQKEGTEVQFIVTDTGIGIEPSALQNLFRPFVQADSTTRRKFGGTGLGLSIAKRFVDLMGGRIGAESQLSVGSSFWFTIPLRTPE